MKLLTVKQVAKLSGVSVRALHHYDQIGLLRPAHIGRNRYRYYGRDELLRLQQILIHRELDHLAPDDRNRRRQIGELIELIEQFARHCSRKRSGDKAIAAHEAAVLRRRFESHLSGGFGD
mgnify:CR=1 FL=1